MSHLLDDFIYRTSLLTLVRGKCRYDRHESVRLVDNEWWGEWSRSSECPLAPEQQCPTCSGTGEVEVTAQEGRDGTENTWTKTKPCEPCGGVGYVPGPHWPYRFPQPPPLRAKKT